MFEHFDLASRLAVTLAAEEARALDHNYIGTEHLLLGLLREREGVAARVLAERKIAIEDVRRWIVAVVGRGDSAHGDGLAFSPRAKRALELALREATRHDHHGRVGTEYVLLGLLRQVDGLAARVLADLGSPPRVLAERVLTTIGLDADAASAEAKSFGSSVPRLGPA